jgi:hypothetical protein
MKQRRYFRTMPPTQLEVEILELAKALDYQDLERAIVVLLDERDHLIQQGQRLPDHVMALLN